MKIIKSVSDLLDLRIYEIQEVYVNDKTKDTSSLKLVSHIVKEHLVENIVINNTGDLNTSYIKFLTTGGEFNIPAMQSDHQHAFVDEEKADRIAKDRNDIEEERINKYMKDLSIAKAYFQDLRTLTNKSKKSVSSQLHEDVKKDEKGKKQKPEEEFEGVEIVE